MLKKILIGLGVLIVLFIGLLLLIPFFYSVDNLRPKIEAAMEKSLRGDVQLGKISLSLFPKVKLTVDGLTITPPPPFQNQPVVRVPNVQLQMSLLSLLSAPRATLELNAPSIQIESRGLQSNLSVVLPETDPNAPKVALGETLQTLPGWIASRVQAARITFAIHKGEISMTNLDGPKGNLTALHGLEVELNNIGLGVPMQLKVEANPQLSAGALSAQGPIKLDGVVTLTPDGKNNNVELDMDAQLKEMDVKMAGLMHKPAGTDFGAKLRGKIVQGPTTTVDLPLIDLVFANAKLGGRVNLVQSADPANSKIDAAFAVNNFGLKPLGNLVPMVRDFSLAGAVDLDLKVAGPLADPVLNVAVAFKGVSGATPQLKKPITDLNGRITVVGTAKNPKVNVDPLTLKIGASDLGLRLSTVGLDPMTVNVAVNSKLLDADELMGLQPLKVGAAAPPSASGTPPPAPTKGPPPAPLDDTLNAMAPKIEEALKNPMLDKITATLVLNFQRIHVVGADLRNATVQTNYARRALVVPKAGLEGYGGKVSMDMRIDLDPKLLGYQMNAKLDRVQVGEFTRIHAPTWKDEMSGALIGTMTLAGRGLRKEQLAKNLTGSLKGELKDGKTSLPVVKLVSGIIEKLPSVAGKPVNQNLANQNFAGQFRTARLDMAIQGRSVQLRELNIAFDSENTKVGPLSFKGAGVVTFDRDVDMTGIAFLSPEIIRIGQLKGPSGQIELPLRFAGKMEDPKPDTGYTLGIVGPRIAKGAAQEAAKKIIAQPKVQEQINKIQEQAPAPVKKGIEDLRKKFGF